MNNLGLRRAAVFYGTLENAKFQNPNVKSMSNAKTTEKAGRLEGQKAGMRGPGFALEERFA
jgi:hypothetical protein